MKQALQLGKCEFFPNLGPMIFPGKGSLIVWVKTTSILEPAALIDLGCFSAACLKMGYHQVLVDYNLPC